MLPLQNTVMEEASKVCSKMGLLKGLCKSIMKKFLRTIAEDIVAGKTSRVICVDIKMCKSKPGMCIGNSRDSFPDSLPVKGKLLTA